VVASSNASDSQQTGDESFAATDSDAGDQDPHDQGRRYDGEGASEEEEEEEEEEEISLLGGVGFPVGQVSTRASERERS
jgi:ribosomal protein L12E/L44/L45/RPP1/RPP2